jgi:hypothetical protein
MEKKERERRKEERMLKGKYELKREGSVKLKRKRKRLVVAMGNQQKAVKWGDLQVGLRLQYMVRTKSYYTIITYPKLGSLLAIFVFIRVFMFYSSITCILSICPLYELFVTSLFVCLYTLQSRVYTNSEDSQISSHGLATGHKLLYY